MKEIMERYGIKAKKSLGQNFLINQDILHAIAQITHIEDENILEIGPGFGALSEKLIQMHPASLTLVELDDAMIHILNDRIEKKELNIEKISFEIIHADVLKIEPNLEKYKVIANIPYYITSPILYRFLYELEQKPESMIILMQKEVGERIISHKSSVLSLFVQKKCTVTEKLFVPRSFFSPPPKVDSSVLYFELHHKYDEIDDKKFMNFIKAAFSNPRKKMINNLAQAGYDKIVYLEKLMAIGFGENTRAEELTIEKYIFLLTEMY